MDDVQLRAELDKASADLKQWAANLTTFCDKVMYTMSGFGVGFFAGIFCKWWLG